ncbi:MAG: SoxR reducing system RseC family protein [Bacteroidales bacterium]|jgi:positive regulator of sigma E activity|nr:SoxR reducing system RseC family protein [Bacteroidales bacterium]
MSIGQELHEGKIVKIEAGIVYVKILVNEACQHCDGKKSCMVFNAKERLIEVKCPNSQDYQVEEIVDVQMATSMGFKAVFYAYLLPVLILILILILGNHFIQQELIPILISFLLLALYYCILYLLRKKIGKKFVFTLQKK